jgi:hypothetical protein
VTSPSPAACSSRVRFVPLPASAFISMRGFLLGLAPTS